MPDIAVSTCAALIRPDPAQAHPGRVDPSQLRVLTGLLVGSIVLLLVIGVVGSMLIRRSWWGMQRSPARALARRSATQTRSSSDPWTESGKRLALDSADSLGTDHPDAPVDLDGQSTENLDPMGGTPPGPKRFDDGPDDDPLPPPSAGPRPKPPSPPERGPRGTGGGGVGGSGGSGGGRGWRPTRPNGPDLPPSQPLPPPTPPDSRPEGA